MCSTAPSCQQPLVMGLGSGMFSMKYPPPHAPLFLPSPAWWPMGQLFPKRLEEEEES